MADEYSLFPILALAGDKPQDQPLMCLANHHDLTPPLTSQVWLVFTTNDQNSRYP